MAEPKWTVNGRATSTAGEPASEPATATAIAGEAVAAQPAKQPTPMTPLDALLTDPSFFTAEEDAEIQRTMAAHKVDRLHPVIQNSVEQLLYRRQYREDWRKYQEAQTKMVARIEDVQEKTLARVEELVTRIEAMSPDVKSARKSGPPVRRSSFNPRRAPPYTRASPAWSALSHGLPVRASARRRARHSFEPRRRRSRRC